MSSRYNREGLKPEVEGLLKALLAARPAERVLDYRQQRALNAASDGFFNVGAPEMAVEREIVIPGPAGDMPALMYSPQAEPGERLPVVMHFHGGGYVFMTPKTFAKFWKQVANEARCVVVSVDYRMGPEDPYPAAVDDAAAAFRWLRAHAGEIGGDGARIALAGESAGGGLAPATTLRLLAEGDAPAAVAIVCPWLDMTMSSQSMRELGPGDPVLDDKVLEYWRGLYAPDASRWKEPEASPVFGDVSTFPPAFVAVGGIDPLCGEGEQFAERLQAAGRDVEFAVYAGMPHIFPTWPQLAALPEVIGVRERTVAFLRRTL